MVAEQAEGQTVKGRRGTLYHLSSTVSDRQLPGTSNKLGPRAETLADLTARRRFSSSRYFLSPSGILKLLVILLFLVSAATFLAEELCPHTPTWYSWLFPSFTLLAAVVTTFMYTFLALGMAEDNPAWWVKLDVSVSLLETPGVATASILTITECSTSKHVSSTVLGPLGLTGVALLAVSAAATYIMWRYRDQDPPAQAGQPQRKSINI